eukprot:scaffold9_cov97-Isochrysis_galbana.AAC.7
MVPSTDAPSAHPATAARCNGVCPSESTADRSAFASRSAWAAEAANCAAAGRPPTTAARWMAVRPKKHCSCRAPAERSSWMHRTNLSAPSS